MSQDPIKRNTILVILTERIWYKEVLSSYWKFQWGEKVIIRYHEDFNFSAGIRKDQGVVKMSERFLGPVGGVRCGNRWSQRCVTHDSAAMWWGQLWKCSEDGKLKLLQLKCNFEIFRLLKNRKNNRGWIFCEWNLSYFYLGKWTKTFR